MLYLERYTIEGVRKRLGEGPAQIPEVKTIPESMPAVPRSQADILKLVKKRLKDILRRIE
jgi:hypothetical protein